MTGMVGYSYLSDQQKNLELAVAQVKGMNNFYFESLNTLMQADDGMDQRELLRKKLLEMPGVVDVRPIRGPEVERKYGKGLPYEHIQDDLDRRAMNGEPVVDIKEKDGTRLITVVQPYFLTKRALPLIEWVV